MHQPTPVQPGEPSGNVPDSTGMFMRSMLVRPTHMLYAGVPVSPCNHSSLTRSSRVIDWPPLRMYLLLLSTTPFRVKPKLNVLVMVASRLVMVMNRLTFGKSNRTGEPAAGEVDDVTNGSAEDWNSAA